MSRQFSPQEEIEIVQRYEGGEGSHVIAIDYGVSAPVIMEILKRNGVQTRDRRTSQTSLLDDEAVDLLCRMYRGGYTAKMLSLKFKISEKRVRKYLEKRGVKKTS